MNLEIYNVIIHLYKYKLKEKVLNRVPMTTNGAKQLRDELEQLKAMRPKISAAIGEAREHGDLKENAEYHAAKEQQGLNEARTRDIEAKLSNAQIIDVSKIADSDRIVFGAIVHLINVDTDEELSYQIVGEDEADIELGKISIGSPLARSLIGKELDDVVKFNAPSGKVEYEITDIEYIT